MGVIGAAAATLGALLLGAWLAGLLEPRLLGAAAERGPAAPARVRLDLRPARRDPWLYAAAPVVALLGVATAAMVVPLGLERAGADLTIGLFYYLVLLDFVALGVALGGWGADTPGAVEACYRAIAQLVAYVVPLGLAVLGPVMMARSLSIADIVAAQREAGLWYVVAQPLGLALYLATALMQVYRAPFLEPFAARLGGGVLGAYGGWKAALWRVALSGVLVVAAAMGAALFLGGPAGPWLPGPIWVLLKTAALLAFLLWAGRRARPRSTAEMLSLAWKALIPAGLLNVLLVGALILLGVGQRPFR